MYDLIGGDIKDVKNESLYHSLLIKDDDLANKNIKVLL